MKTKGYRNHPNFNILQIQQQISHYNHLIQAKPEINLHSSLPITPSRLRSKFCNEIERSRLLENNNLVRKLTQIKHSKGILHQDNYRQRLINGSYSLQSDYKIMKNEKERIRHNEILLDKLKTAKPQVGTCYQWNEHFEQFQNNQKKLSKVNVQLLGLEDLFYSTYAGITSKQSRSRKLASQHIRYSVIDHNKSIKKCECEQNQVMPEQYTTNLNDNHNKLVEIDDNPEHNSYSNRRIIAKGNNLNCEQTKKHKHKQKNPKRKHKKAIQQTQGERQSSTKVVAQLQEQSTQINNIYKRYDKHT